MTSRTHQAVTGACLAVVALLAGLVVTSVLPVAVGWRSNVVLSGSMRPALPAGDVVVSSPAGAGALSRGQVVLVRDPAEPGQLLVHRVVGVGADGALTTRGDANASADSTSVPRADVLGLVRVRVPQVGLVSLWARQGRVLPLVLVLVAAVLVSWRAATGLTAPRSAPAGPAGPAAPATSR